MGNKHSYEEVETEVTTGIKTYLNTKVNLVVKALDNTTNKVINQFISEHKSKAGGDASIKQSIDLSNAVIKGDDIKIENIADLTLNVQTMMEIGNNIELSNELQDTIKNSISQRAQTDSDLSAQLNATNILDTLKSKSTDGEINNMVDAVKDTITGILTSSDTEQIKRTKITNIVETHVDTTISSTTDVEHILNQIFENKNSHTDMSECFAKANIDQDIKAVGLTIDEYTKRADAINTAHIKLGTSCYLKGVTKSDTLNAAIGNYYDDITNENLTSNRVKDDQAAVTDIKDINKEETKSFVSDFMNNLVYIILGIAVIVILFGGIYLLY